MAEIKVNEIVEPTCNLYNPDDEWIGQIESTLQLYDVRLQIKNKGVSGYYVLYHGQKIRIDKFGNVEKWPIGFYDKHETQLIGLL